MAKGKKLRDPPIKPWRSVFTESGLQAITRCTKEAAENYERDLREWARELAADITPEERARADAILDAPREEPAKDNEASGATPAPGGQT